MAEDKPLLVGETNPHGKNPAFALYPYPARASGDRLCRIVMGLTPHEYLARFDRANLCVGTWSIVEARVEAGRIARERRGSPIVLCGAKVAQAFSFKYQPFTVLRPRILDGDAAWDGLFVVLPHPSGLCRTWGEPGAIERARAALREGGALQ